MRVFIKSPTVITATVVFLQLSSTAFATDLGDCGHPSADRSIRGCSLLIELGHALPAKQAEFLLLRGTAHMINDDNDQAIKDLGEVIRLNPNEPEAFLVRGDAYFKKGDYDRAMADYDQASWLNPDHIEAYIARLDVYKKLRGDNHGRGDSAFLGGKFNEVFRHMNWRAMVVWHPEQYRQRIEGTFPPLDEAIRRNPNDAEAYFKRAIAYRDFGEQQYDRALADYDQAIRLDPDHVNAYNGRGFVYRMKGQYDRAIADIDRVLRVQPNNATALSNRGIAYRMKGDYDRAIADLSEAIRLLPREAQLYQSRGLAYESKGDRDKAIADYRWVLTLHKSPVASPAVAPSMYGLKRLGVDFLDPALPDPAQQIARLDETIARLGERSPKSGSVYSSRCSAYLKKGEYDRAIADCDQAILLTPATAKVIIAAAHNRRGMAYRYKGDLERAIHDFDHAIRLHFGTAEHHYNRGQAYADKGDHERAIEDYIHAIRLHPKMAEYYSSRGLAHERRGEQEKAIADYRKARQVHELNTKDASFTPSIEALKRLGARP